MTKQEFLAMSLPYGLMFKNLNENTNEQLSGVDTYLVANWSLPLYPNGTICVYSSIDYSSIWSINEVKPILHPLSDLKKKIEHNGEKFVPIEKLGEIIGGGWCVVYERAVEIMQEWDIDTLKDKIKYLPFEFVQFFVSWHFDIADLISKGEAIDVNTFEVNPYN